jgi:hypothetical protein
MTNHLTSSTLYDSSPRSDWSTTPILVDAPAAYRDAYISLYHYTLEENEAKGWEPGFNLQTWERFLNWWTEVPPKRQEWLHALWQLGHSEVRRLATELYPPAT